MPRYRLRMLGLEKTVLRYGPLQSSSRPAEGVLARTAIKPSEGGAPPRPPGPSGPRTSILHFSGFWHLHAGMDASEAGGLDM